MCEMEDQQKQLDDVIELVWGPCIQPQLFQRWSQGFVFSCEEATALQQHMGGPCSIIAPVQAFLTKNLIQNYSMDQLKQVSAAAVDGYLAASLSEMLCLCAVEACRAPEVHLVHHNGDDSSFESSLRIRVVAPEREPVSAGGERRSNESAAADLSLLHSRLRIQEFRSRGDLSEHIKSHLGDFKADLGVLCFLYSALLTRGATKGSPCLGGGEGGSEPLISGEEGHGEQSLLNLLITGTPSSHVFDGTNDLGGMKLLGVWRRPSVGLLHLQEHYRQLKVGWYLKNPLHPVWLCASQHHITVVFSLQRELVCPASEIERGHQVFSWYDTEGNGFIQQSQLLPVLQHLGLCTDEQFVKFMCEELDPDNMGVILYHKFQDAFFSGEQLHTAPDTFTLFHYNGLPASNPQKKVQYAKGFATRQESHVPFSSLQDLTACLSTKWPNVELQWEDNFKPSMN